MLPLANLQRRFCRLESDLNTAIPNQLKVISAWDAMAARVLPNGEMTLIIGGTGIKSDEAGYEPSDTDYRGGGAGEAHLQN